ncbi:rapid alkalinization factor-like [Zingiber officinale]|uniref:rapid alkalinization factor-like n=1 Tax=Zingiber officinale TaxID=94328 RepID=UPI001C4CEA9F|nr:rapid alkalinization factor-like [Zingiber officinale]
MAKLQRGALLSLAFLLAAVLLAPASAGGEPNALPLGWISSLSGCRGSIAECLAGDEFDLGSQASRRILATSGYISYGALRRDTTPCSRRGASYYNCRPGAEANPYSRSCSTISQCRG